MNLRHTIGLVIPAALFAVASSHATENKANPFTLLKQMNEKGKVVPKAPPPPEAELKMACPYVSPAGGEKMPFGFGERLSYKVTVAGVHAGNMHLDVAKQKDYNGSAVIPVRVDAKSTDFFSKLRKVTGSMTAYIDPASMLTRYYQAEAKIGELSKTSEVTFDHAARKVSGSYGRNKLTWKSAHAMPPFMADTLSMLYYLRTRKIETGQPMCADIYYDTHFWKVTGKVTGREDVVTDQGLFKSWVISGIAVRRDDRSWVRRMRIFVTDDDKRIPVQIEADVKFGYAVATLTGHREAKERFTPSPGEAAFAQQAAAVKPPEFADKKILRASEPPTFRKKAAPKPGGKKTAPKGAAKPLPKPAAKTAPPAGKK